LTLVSPLFGDLRTQALVKCLTLLLQTICFLFLCSIAPASGFGGSKPKLCRKHFSDQKLKHSLLRHFLWIHVYFDFPINPGTYLISFQFKTL